MITETRRILLDGAPVEMTLSDGVLHAQDGRTISPDAAVHLPPVQPSKIICVHLNYQNRIDELKTEGPPAPNYFLKAPSSLNGHKVGLSLACLLVIVLANLRGDARVVRMGDLLPGGFALDPATPVTTAATSKTKTTARKRRV